MTRTAAEFHGRKPIRLGPRALAVNHLADLAKCQEVPVCRILLAVDGSESSKSAVRLVIKLHPKLAPVDLHVLTVQAPVHIERDAATSEKPGEQNLVDEAEMALTSATALLDDAGVPYTRQIQRGYIGSSIAAYANDNHCDSIIMGTRGMGATDQLLGSIARQVIHLARVPVTLVK